MCTSFSTLFCDEIFSIDHALVSVCAVHSESGKILISNNSDLSLIPASCMKIVTTGAALHLLDPNSRFETHLEYDGWIDGQTLHGNIYIKGEGDPCLGSDRIPGNPSWQKQIDIWANEIQKLGIHQIKGTIIADATKWEKAMAVPSWAWEDLGNYYGAGASALSFHENFYAVSFKPGNKVGENTSILKIDPPVPSLMIQNEVKTGPEGSGDGACIYGTEFSFQQFMRGTIPLGVDEFTIKGAMPDAGIVCAELLARELQSRNVTIDKKNLELGHRTKFYTSFSPLLKEIIYWANQKSVNLYAEHLLKKIGEKTFQEGTTEAGIKAITNFWRSQNIDLAGFHMADGSGLSRKNLVTAKQFVEILLKMKGSPFFPDFFESLPQNTMAIKAKSGSMSLIRGYVGYSGEIAFAIIVNHCSNSVLMKEKLNSMLSHLSQLNEDLEN